MRFSVLFGLVLLVAARHAGAQPQEPDESAIELGPPPPPPPGARVTNPDEPTPIAPNPAPILEEPEPEPDPIVLGETKPPKDHGVRPSQPSEASRWYGWKILIADGGAFTLAMISQPVGSVLGGGAYVLTAPAIHLGHKRGLPALGSLGMRIAAPLVLHAVMGEEPCSGDVCFQPGILLGATLASLVDVVVLAHDGGSPTPRKAERVAPTVAASAKGTVLGVRGTF